MCDSNFRRWISDIFWMWNDCRISVCNKGEIDMTRKAWFLISTLLVVSMLAAACAA